MQRPESGRIAVTGGSGFIGSHVVDALLSRGFQIVALGRSRSKYWPGSIEFRECDLLNGTERRAAMRDLGATSLIHLAWYVEPGKLIAAPENMDWLAASVDLLREFRALGGERVLVAGSAYEFDWRFGYCSEGLTPRIPDTLYGACKNALRDAFLSYCATAGMTGVWARLFFLYGPRENPRRLVPSVAGSLLRGITANVSHGLQIRDYMHVEDAAKAIVALFASGAQGDFNIATGRPVALREIVTRLASQLERADLLNIGAVGARANDAPLVVADVQRLQALLGPYEKYDLDSGLRHTIEWWRAELKAGQ